MSNDNEPPLVPLRQGSDEISALLRNVPEPAPLTTARARRILEAVYDDVAQPRARRWPLAAAALGLAATAAALLFVRWPAPAPAPVPAPVTVAHVEPRPPAVPIEAAPVEPARWVTLGGVAEARDGGVILRSGRLLLATGTAPTRVELPSRHAALTVQPRSLVDVRVNRWRMQVSAFSGGTLCESRDFGTRALPNGHTLTVTDELVERANDPAAAAQTQKLLDAGGELAERDDGLTPTMTAPEATQTMATTATDDDPAPEAPAPTAPSIAVPAPTAPSIAVPAPTAPSIAVPAAPAPTTNAPSGPSALALETASFERAVRALRRDHDSTAALRAVDSYLQAYPHGLMQPDAVVLRAEALLALGRRDDALAALDGQSLAQLPRADEMAVVRGELRAAAGRCADADADLAPLAAHDDALAERAWMARAECRAHRNQPGDDTAARALLEEYRRRFPHGRFADRAAKILKN